MMESVCFENKKEVGGILTPCVGRHLGILVHREFIISISCKSPSSYRRAKYNIPLKPLQQCDSRSGIYLVMKSYNKIGV